MQFLYVFRMKMVDRGQDKREEFEGSVSTGGGPTWKFGSNLLTSYQNLFQLVFFVLKSKWKQAYACLENNCI